MINKLRKFLKRLLEEYLVGTIIQERSWSKRHLKRGNDWANKQRSGEANEWVCSYWDSKNHSHRPLLVEKISKFLPISSVLEIGCNCGPNLYLLSKKFTEAQIKGIDINPEAIKIGKELFAKEGIKNVDIFLGKADELKQFKDNSIDIVFTDAVLIYVGKDKIKKVIEEMLRIAKKAIVLTEWHYEDKNKDPRGLGIYYSGRWIRNYVNLLKSFVPEKQIYLTKITNEIWPDSNWREFGHIIEVIK